MFVQYLTIHGAELVFSTMWCFKLAVSTACHHVQYSTDKTIADGLPFGGVGGSGCAFTFIEFDAFHTDRMSKLQMVNILASGGLTRSHTSGLRSIARTCKRLISLVLPSCNFKHSISQYRASHEQPLPSIYG